MRIGILLSFIVLLCLSGCYYDSEEDLYPSAFSFCDSVNVDFDEDVLPIFETHCNAAGCHNSTAAAANIILDTYAGADASASNGSLLGSILHESGYSPMPWGREKLNDCQITIITNWVNRD